MQATNYVCSFSKTDLKLFVTFSSSWGSQLTGNQLPSVLWRSWLGGRKDIRPVKTEWWGAGVVISLEQGADLRMAPPVPLPLTVSCFSEIQIGFTFLVLGHPGSPRKKGLCVNYASNQLCMQF